MGDKDDRRYSHHRHGYRHSRDRDTDRDRHRHQHRHYERHSSQNHRHDQRGHSRESSHYQSSERRYDRNQVLPRKNQKQDSPTKPFSEATPMGPALINPAVFSLPSSFPLGTYNTIQAPPLASNTLVVPPPIAIPSAMPADVSPWVPIIHQQVIAPPKLDNLVGVGVGVGVDSLGQRLFTKDALQKLHLPPDQVSEKGIVPKLPYYELPVGLMVPLVSADQKDYKPLDPTELRLPLPKIPDENFLRAIDSFYNPSSHHRDNDGWERSFLEACSAKNK